MSTKWADYVLTAVRYNSMRTRITDVQMRLDLGDKLGKAENYSRQQVVSLLNQNRTIVTAFYKQGTWHIGDTVETFTRNGIDFIRTVGNQGTADNLGNIAEF